ncbi:MAG: penicillin-binding transpeptidase domain-containing protein [Acidimicrobiaceae bacterium]|nr:penicillin-binding transpeptidase domain-containing protein [Acidimicrobiaceae bacterium]
MVAATLCLVVAACVAGAACAGDPAPAPSTEDPAAVEAVVRLAADAHGGPVAVLAVDNSTGETVAAATAGDAAHAPLGGGARPAASLVKAVVLAAALESGVAPHDVLIVPQCIPLAERLACTTRPGEVTVLEAAAHSNNPAFVLLADRAGPDAVAGYGARVGMELVPSRLLPLGLDAVTMESVAALFVALANDGETPAVAGRDGAKSLGAAGRFVSAETARAMRKVLRVVVTDGTGRAADGPDEPYGKTGTAEGRTDAWFAGVSGDLTIVVWAGARDGAAAPGTAGIDAPAGAEADYETLLDNDEQPAGGGPRLTGGGLPARVFREVANLLSVSAPAA